MHPRPLHRSITFWSGILVMAFICWAWRDSLRHATHASYQFVVVTNGWGGLRIDHLDSNIPFDFKIESADLTNSHEQPNLFREPVFLTLASRSEKQILEIDARMASCRPYTDEEGMMVGLYFAYPGPDSWRMFIPHWLILLAIALPWSALLLWRARRGKLQAVVEANP